MKQARNNSSNGSYRLTDKGKRFAQENRPVPFKVTAKGVAFVKDHKAKLGAIPESENLPRAASQQSHVDLINEEIELFEAEKPLSKGDKLAILMDCSDRLHQRWLAAWDAYTALSINHVHRIAAWKKVDQLTKAASRVTRKINDLLS